jgi:hypothetical protein
VMEKIRLKKEEDWNLNRLEQEIMIAVYSLRVPVDLGRCNNVLS